MKTRDKPFTPGRHEQRRADPHPDAYASEQKLSGPAVCSECGVAYHDGRWQWVAPAAEAEAVLCPACRRIKDGIPAGYVYIEDAPPGEKRDQMVQLIRHHETRARAEHPLQRVMAIEEAPLRITVTTTDEHLARDLATAVKAAFGGSTQFDYAKDEHLLRAYRHA